MFQTIILINKEKIMRGFWNINFILLTIVACGTDRNFENPLDPKSDKYNKELASKQNNVATPTVTASAIPEPSAISTQPGNTNSGNEITPAPGSIILVEPSPTAVATSTPIANTSIVKFPDTPNKIFNISEGEEFINLIENSNSNNFPWLITKKSSNLFAVKFDPNTTNLSYANSSIQFTGLNGNCTTGGLSPKLILGISDTISNLYSISNCTGDNNNRYWQQNLSTTALDSSSYLSNSLAFNSCVYNPNFSIYKCGNKIVDSSFNLSLGNTITSLITNASQQKATKAGFAMLEGKHFVHFKYPSGDICDLTLNENYHGILTDNSSSSEVLLYNGKIIEKVNLNNCSSSVAGNSRTSSLGIESNPLVISDKDGNLISIWTTANSLFFDKVTLTPQVKLVMLYSQSVNNGQVYLIKRPQGYKLIYSTPTTGNSSLFVSDIF